MLDPTPNAIVAVPRKWRDITRKKRTRFVPNAIKVLLTESFATLAEKLMRFLESLALDEELKNTEKKILRELQKEVEDFGNKFSLATRENVSVAVNPSQSFWIWIMLTMMEPKKGKPRRKAMFCMHG
jgi:hypothetical protein